MSDDDRSFREVLVEAAAAFGTVSLVWIIQTLNQVKESGYGNITNREKGDATTQR